MSVPHQPVTAEECAAILRLHHVEGWPVGTIANQLHRHHDTIATASARPRSVNASALLLESARERHPRPDPPAAAGDRYAASAAPARAVIAANLVAGRRARS
jgi:hypothetical protein